MNNSQNVGRKKNRREFKRWFSIPVFLTIALVFSNSLSFAQNTNSPGALKKLSMEELMDQDVTIVTKTPEKLSQSPSAVQVITGEDIKRSGATSLPEALRLAPNLEVAQVNAQQWAISARGFNNTLANKLLVMIDGRSIYTPLDAGVFWDVQNVLLEDVDQIEVVSGPGGSLWGANAVNGVINIVTKSARDTQGLYVSGAGGSFLQDWGAVRYGGEITSNLFYRAYVQRFDHNGAELPGGTAATNSWDMTQGGFRSDYYPSDINTLTLQGDAYSGTEAGTTAATPVDGENVLGRWTRTLSEESDLSLQTYFDRTWRNVPGIFAEDLKTYDVDFQHRFPIGDRNNILWGAGYRLMQDEVKNGAVLAFLPPNFNMQLASAFVQDEIVLVPDRLKFTLGTKVEHNDFSGFEVEPSGRIAWTPDERQTVWAAISRAVRSPSRVDTDFFAPAAGPPFLLGGGTNFTSEKVIAYELGYRVRPTKKLSLSLAGFFNEYDDIRSVESSGGTFFIANGLHAQSWGLELSGEFQAADWWRLRGGYNYLNEKVWQKSGHVDINNAQGEGDDPQNQFSLQSIMDLPANFQFDATARYVDALPHPGVPGYFTFDLRLAWTCQRFEFSVVGQNLWDGQHAEFGAAATRQEIPRSIYGKVTCRF
ncbi:MAG TPA: TonB-dependent receptor plug domain-containing protein [Methylomirabilota bacterium]|nr:TonB-dependent receptor plug domain-containing protein [Methylomirabilota bacterium]